MKISKHSVNTIKDEINYAVAQMRESKTYEEKLYYFSAIHGIIKRIFNIEYNPDLVFIHSILNETYTAFLQRLAAMKRGDSVVDLMQDQIKRLEDLAEKLGANITDSEMVNEIMKNFTLLSYSTTGNGFYLLRKGFLEF